MKSNLIVKVHYDEKRSRIVQCKCIEKTGDSNEQIISRDQIIEAIENQKVEYYTFHKGVRCAKVMVYKINNENYIKTMPNDKAEDNLGELPEYRLN
ncbi:MAG: DUF3892 domain-containing protein [Spirochaetaceae bacterium]|nr:MAG: DUF3892 domain-containing protein [Spirochaetaceae bacterium]